MAPKEHISVCICTYERPELLTRALEGLTAQKVDERFDFSLVVVDNDPAKSGYDIVAGFKEKSSVRINYFNQPRVGLSYARNMALDNCVGEYVAIIDDDEVPVKDWLLHLYNTLNGYDAVAVYGSVLPVFETDPPEWVLTGKVFYWRDERGPTGIKVSKGATNNVLFRKSSVDRLKLRFDPIFAQSGGCDEDFFRRMKGKGDIFVACSEAIVYEFFPQDRCNSEYIKKRNILEGSALVRIIRNEKNYLLFGRRFIQAGVTLALSALLSPLLLFVAKSTRMTRYYKCCFHAGVLLEMLHFSPYKDRKSIGLQGE